MIFCKELNKEFATKDDMFAELKASRDHIVNLKKAELKCTDPVLHYIHTTESLKADEDQQTIGVGSVIYPIINSCHFLDSHGDVHIKGLWDVSLKDQKNKLYYLINHDLMIGSVVAYPKNVEAYVQDIKWRDMGMDYDGETQILVYKVTLTEASNKDFVNAVKERVELQNSVRMRYISMTLCIDSPKEDLKQEKANFDKYLKLIANKDRALDEGYFWAITEAAVHKEGSAVLFGSNEATPILYDDPQKSSQQESKDITIDPPQVQSEINNKSLTFNLI